MSGRGGRGGRNGSVTQAPKSGGGGGGRRRRSTGGGRSGSSSSYVYYDTGASSSAAVVTSTAPMASSKDPTAGYRSGVRVFLQPMAGYPPPSRSHSHHLPVWAVIAVVLAMVLLLFRVYYIVREVRRRRSEGPHTAKGLHEDWSDEARFGENTFGL